MNLRPKILLAIDLVLGATLVLLELGSAVCFGGAVWWFRPAAAFTAFVLAGTKLVRLLVTGRMHVLEEPIDPFGSAAFGVGTLQLVPLPPRLARALSPMAHEIYQLRGLAGACERRRLPRPTWASRPRCARP